MKITEIEGKIPDVSSLVTKSAVAVVENKIPDVSSFVKKTNFNTKVTEIENKIPDVSNLVKKNRLCYRNNLDKKRLRHKCCIKC